MGILRELFGTTTLKGVVLKTIENLGGVVEFNNLCEEVRKIYPFNSYQLSIEERTGYKRYKHLIGGSLQALKKEGKVILVKRGMWCLKDKMPNEGDIENIKKPKEINDNKLLLMLKKELRDIKLFIENTTPSVNTEKLCFWVWLCYTFEFYREGALIFRKIEKGNIQQDFYSIIRKIGEACELKSV